MPDPHALEQEELHFRGTIVKAPEFPFGFIKLIELRQTLDNSYWTFIAPKESPITALAPGLWLPLQKLPVDELLYLPHYPSSGFYQTPKGAAFYTRSTKKQWRRSFLLESPTSIIRRLKSPLQREEDPLTELELVHSLFNPYYPSLEEAIIRLKEPNNITSCALTEKLALINVYPNAPPVVLYQELPVGYLTNNFEVKLAPGLEEFSQDIEPVMEVVFS